jgi:outer membrane protein TolC
MHGAWRIAAPVLAIGSGLVALPAGAQTTSTAPATTAAPAGSVVGSGRQPVAVEEAPAAGRAVGVNECVAVALRQNPDAQTGEFAVREAQAQRAEARGYFGPAISADANIQEFNSPFAIPFGGAAFSVRDQFTWTAGVTVTEQLSGLFAIYDKYKVTDLGVDVAAIRRAATRREVAFETIQAYYRLLEAQRLQDVASASVTQLEAQRKQAQSQFDNGVIGKNDLLRAVLALAQAKQRSIQTRGQVVIARGRLNTVMGIPADQPLEPEPFNGEPPPVGEAALESAEARAVGQRLELRDLARQVDQAEANKSFAKRLYMPSINAVGNWTHTAGSLFAPPNQEYVGILAHWNVFDWGTTINGVNEADAKLHQAILARKKLEDQVRLEARQAFVEAQTAREALDVARTAVSQAEENFRIVTKKYDNAAATSFDVVDAESLLTQARGQVEQALYDYLIAGVALQKATGSALPGDGT